jgi:type IV secretion system protein TrbL
VAFLTATLIVIDMTIAGLYWAMSHATGQGEDVIAKLLRKVLYVGAFAYIIGNFNWLASIVFRSFAGLGITATGSAITMENFLQPGRLAKTGIDAAAPILEQIGDMAGFPEVFVNIDPIVVLFIAWLVVILCFFVLAVQLFITLIEFKLTTLAGFVLIPFALWNKTSFLAEKVLGNVVSSGIKVLVLAVIVGIGSGLFAEFQVHPDEPSIDHALVVMLASLACWRWASSAPASPPAWCPVRRSSARARWLALRRASARRCHRCRRDGRGRCRHGGARMAPAAAKLAGAARAPPRRRPAAPSRRSRPVPLRPAAVPRARRRASAMSPRPARKPQAAAHLWRFRCRAEGGRLLPRWLERHGCRRRCRPGQPQAAPQLAEARATRLGQADAPPPADHPCRDHRRPHAARWRRRRLRARPEPARFRYLTFKENTHAIQTTAGALRRHAAACHPYQAAAQVWDERIGSARVQAKNWRLMAFGCLTLALLMAGGLVWRSAQSIVTPYVIEVDQPGRCAPWAAATPYRPGDAQIAHHLARFVTLVRSLSIDPIVVRQNWLDAYDYTTDKGAAVLNDYARTNDPFARIGKESVTVQITSVVRASDTSFNVRWTEQRFVNGAPAGTERWNAVLSTVLQTPRTEQRLRKNPLGIYVNGLSWSRELDSSEGAKP